MLRAGLLKVGASMLGQLLAADAGYRPELGEPWEVAKVYWCCIPKSVLQEGIDAMAAAGDDSFFEGAANADDLPFGVDDHLVTAAGEHARHDLLIDGVVFCKQDAQRPARHARQNRRGFRL